MGHTSNTYGNANAWQDSSSAMGSIYGPNSLYNLPIAGSQSSRKRKSTAEHAADPRPVVIDLTQDSPPAKRRSTKYPEKYDALSVAPEHSKKKCKTTSKKDADELNPKKKAKLTGGDEEKRLRRFRNHPPTTYLEVKSRALTQRMFALDRQRNVKNPDHPTEQISLAGTTGNVYTIIIDKVPSCNCPHAKKGNQCKHIAYVLSRILRVPENLEYQLAFLSSELREIFAKAPPLPSETAEKEEQSDNRKPLEGECPICVCDFEPESGEAIVYCKAACGNNIHKTCFEQWAATKRGGAVPCPFCRAPWRGDEDSVKNLAKGGPVNAEGYVNVASQMGLSGRRDYSSYHSYWVRRQAENRTIAWDDDGVMDHEYR